MKTSNRAKQSCHLAIPLILLIFLAQNAHAYVPLPGTNAPLPRPMASWSFHDTNHWTSDQSYAPISFTNLAFSYLGNGSSLIVNTNVPAWLNFNINETNGATNLVINAPGSIIFWYGAGWATTNGGPGQRAQLIDVGEPNSPYGYWGLSVDAAGSNLWFSSQDGAGNTYSLSAPISWTTNDFHFIALTYASTNVSLYVDGQLATNDPGGLSVWPSSIAVANGLFFGSDTNGNQQAQGMLDAIQTYNFLLNSTNVQEIYNKQLSYYELSPLNVSYMALNSSPSSPSYAPTFEAVSGPGNLLPVGSASSCVDGSSAYDVWITNVVASMASNGTMNMTFTIEGGEPDYPYDVFANSVLNFGTNTVPWAWMGQGYQCNTYMLTNLPITDCFIILGTPYSSNPGLGLTDAYELFVLEVNPSGPQFDAYGVPYAWYAEHGLAPVTGNLATQDPDMDALPNYQEYLYGTDPQHSEGFAIWISTPNGTSSIP